MKRMSKPENILKMLGIAALAAVLGFSLAACGGSSPSDPDPSDVATLSGITIKGVAATLGTPNATLGSETETAGTVSLLGDEAESDAETVAEVTNANAAVTKIVKYASGDTENATTFAAATAYAGEDVAHGDFFVFEVTAENGAKLYYRVNAAVVEWKHTLAAANVPGANAANVSFYLRDDAVPFSAYNTTTYAEITAILGDPVTEIDSNDAGKHLYAVEFTAAGSGTVVAAGKLADALTGNDTDKALSIALTAAEDPPPPPSAAINGAPVTVEATIPNYGGDGGLAANVTLTINLSNATVDEALSGVNAASWFSARAGLTYTATAGAGGDTITIAIGGTPTGGDSGTSTTITIPVGVLLDDNNNPVNPLLVTGSVNYNISVAENPAITGFAMATQSGPVWQVGNANVALGAVIGSFGAVQGGTAPFTYALVAGDGATDNVLFTIAGADLKVGNAALTVAKTYSVRVAVTDAAGETFAKVFTITVEAPPAGTSTFTLDPTQLYTYQYNMPASPDVETAVTYNAALTHFQIPTPDGQLQTELPAADAFDGGAASASIAGGDLSFSFGTPKAAALLPIDEVGLSPGVVASDPDALVFQFVPVFTVEGTGDKITLSPEDKAHNTYVIPFYVDRPFTLTGTAVDGGGGDTTEFNCTFTPGWSFMIGKMEGNTTTMTTGTIPATCKWYAGSFDTAPPPPPPAPPITGVTFTFVSNLVTHPSNVGDGAPIGEFSAHVGGKAPYTYSFISIDGEDDRDDDNALFAFDSNRGERLIVGSTALTERTYRVLVRIADSSEPQPQTFDKALSIFVDDGHDSP